MSGAPPQNDRGRPSTCSATYEKIRFVEPVPTGEQYGIAFPEDSALVEPVNEALAEIKADGTYERLYKKWFGMPPEDVP